MLYDDDLLLCALADEEERCILLEEFLAGRAIQVSVENGYVAEDGVTGYVAEDGITSYVQET